MGLTGFDWFGMVCRKAISARIITQQSHLAKISTSPIDDGRNRIYINFIGTGIGGARAKSQARDEIRFN